MTDATPTKRCPGFDPEGGEYHQPAHELPADLANFNSNKGAKDGLSSRCRQCGNAYGKAWAAGKRAAAKGEAITMPTRTYQITEAGSLEPEQPAVRVSAVPPPEQYHDQLAVDAKRGRAPGYSAELVGDTWYALPTNGDASSDEGQAALEAVNAARLTERRRADAERKRLSRAAAKQKALQEGEAAKS